MKTVIAHAGMRVAYDRKDLLSIAKACKYTVIQAACTGVPTHQLTEFVVDMLDDVPASTVHVALVIVGVAVKP